MNSDVSLLFHQLVDLSPAERERFFQERGVGPDLRSAVESLLEFDSTKADCLTDAVSNAAGQVLWLAGSGGATVGAYTLVSPIGRGGMGSVWLAERSDGRFERQVAVKFLSIAFGGPGGEERFKREGSILGRLTHPHIAQLVDAGVSHVGQPYLVLEHVDGQNIDEYCDQHALDVEARIRLFLDVLAAVAHAHANLIVHRDIKPSNVLVSRDGQVKLLDFGIAKLLEDSGSAGAATVLTREGPGPLTPEYAAPEQVTGGPVTTATDVYALGVLLFVLLTGQHPAGPGRHSPACLVRAIVDSEPPHLSDAVSRANTPNAARRSTTPDKLRRLLRGDLDTIVAKALKKDPQERYAGVTTLADDLRGYLLHEPISARPDTLAYRTGKFVRRNQTAVALAALACFAFVAGLAGTMTQARTACAQRDFALRQLSRAEAINDLNSFVLSDAAPSGRPFTVNQLLDRAEHIVQRRHGEGDAGHVELLISIGYQYWSQDEDAKARRVLEEAYQRSRALPERSIRARAACALAAVFARGLQGPERAEALIQEGLRELPHAPQFVLDRVFCLERGTGVAGEQGAPQKAIARALEAQRLLKESPLKSELLELQALMNLAESYRIAGHFPAAYSAFEQAYARLIALGRDDTQTAGTLLNNWGLTVNMLGRPLEAEKLYRRAIAVSSSDNNEDSVSPMLLVNEARALRALARFQEAADYAERAYAIARQAGDEVVVTQSLLMRGSAYNGLGDPERAAEMWSAVEPRFRSKFPAGHFVFAVLASERSVTAEVWQDFARALDLANQAVAIGEASIKTGGPGLDFMPTLLVRRSSVELHLHRADRAAADATRALRMLRESSQSGTFSHYIGGANLALGRALQAQGKDQEARAALLSAADHLQNTVGINHPDTRTARQMAGLPD